MDSPLSRPGTVTRRLAIPPTQPARSAFCSHRNGSPSAWASLRASAEKEPEQLPGRHDGSVTGTGRDRRRHRACALVRTACLALLRHVAVGIAGASTSRLLHKVAPSRRLVDCERRGAFLFYSCIYVLLYFSVWRDMYLLFKRCVPLIAVKNLAMNDIYLFTCVMYGASAS